MNTRAIKILEQITALQQELREVLERGETGMSECNVVTAPPILWEMHSAVGAGAVKELDLKERLAIAEERGLTIDAEERLKTALGCQMLMAQLDALHIPRQSQATALKPDFSEAVIPDGAAVKHLHITTKLPNGEQVMSRHPLPGDPNLRHLSLNGVFLRLQKTVEEALLQDRVEEITLSY